MIVENLSTKLTLFIVDKVNYLYQISIAKVKNKH